MKIKQGSMQYELPRNLHVKLVQFRKRVWSIKSAEGLFVVVAVAALTYLAVFAFDRLGETPSWLRTALLLTALSGLFLFLPWKLFHWVWQRRELSQLARLLSWDQPRVGDRLLGVIELVQKGEDGNSSPALCRAAIQQVADDTADIDFNRSVPTPRHRQWGWVAAGLLGLSLVALFVPGAGVNAFQRWLKPLANIPRYTFTQLAELPPRQVVAIGEPFSLVIPLSEDTVWKPAAGQVQYGNQSPVQAKLTDAGYEFEIPAQTDAAPLKVKIGDARHAIDVEPMTRPELKSLLARIQLPDYLGYDPQKRDVRSGAVTVVRGSRASFDAVASRPLAEAAVNGDPTAVAVTGETIRSEPIAVDEVDTQEFVWTDVEGLSAKSPFKLKIRATDDRAPTLQCSNLPMEKVLLDEEALSFEVAASDDFGIKKIGVEWSGIEDPRRNPEPQKGEYELAKGDKRKAAMTAHGVFTAKSLGVEPQPIHLRVYTEDYKPGRERVYSPVYRLYVLNREQHMIWVTEQLQQWERQALEVRDEEQRLLDTNQELQNLSPEELDTDAARQQIARQAAAERANARRLDSLTQSGEQLITDAARNPEFDVATLEKWAAVLKALKGLSKNEMPSVANLLANSANAAKAQPPKPSTAPSVSDSVRGADPDAEAESEDEEKSDSEPQESRGGGSLQLPTTILPGSAKPNNGGKSSPAGQELDQAVEEQQLLLAEFNKVMDELSQIMQDLQGSTFVKRLKAAADAELSIASDLHGRLGQAFGADSTSLTESNQELLKLLYVKQGDNTRNVRLIQEDLAAYFERTRREPFQTVHDEMKETRIVSNFKQMSQALDANYAGDTIAQAEFWSDKLDRWAEILVGPANACGKCPGGKGDSLPPSIVLEVMRILKAEVDLRDTTRVVEQTRDVENVKAHQADASKLKTTQDDLVNRTELVISQLEKLQLEQGKNYSKPLRQLLTAVNAMSDASRLLAEPETGPPTIAAETEAIEALLITKRANSGGGGGGGSSPGGGGGEGEADTASALAGIGDDIELESRDVAQSTGNMRDAVPEEFRRGLDAYLNAIDGQEGG